MNAKESAEEDLERILQLALRARITDRACNNRHGQSADDAIDAHGEACDNLWAELYRQLEVRDAGDDPVHPPKLPPDPRKEIKKQIVARLKDELPGMVASIIDEF